MKLEAERRDVLRVLRMIRHLLLYQRRVVLAGGSVFHLVKRVSHVCALDLAHSDLEETSSVCVVVRIGWKGMSGQYLLITEPIFYP